MFTYNRRLRKYETESRFYEHWNIQAEDEEDEDIPREQKVFDVSHLVDDETELIRICLNEYLRYIRVYHSARDVVNVITQYAAPYTFIISVGEVGVKIGTSQANFVTCNPSNNQWWSDSLVMSQLRKAVQRTQIKHIVLVNEHQSMAGSQYSSLQTLFSEIGAQNVCHLPKPVSLTASVPPSSTCFLVHLGYLPKDCYILPFYENFACVGLQKQLCDSLCGANITQRIDDMVNQHASIRMNFEDFRRTKKSRWTQLARLIQKNAYNFLMESTEDSCIRFELPGSGYGQLTWPQLFESVSYKYNRLANEIHRFLVGLTKDESTEWLTKICKRLVVSTAVEVPWFREQLQAELDVHEARSFGLEVFAADEWSGAAKISQDLHEEHWILATDEEHVARAKSDVGKFYY